MIAKEVLDTVGSLLNDQILSVYTYSVQIPYLNIALAELQEECELNNTPTTNAHKTIVSIAAGTEGIGGGNGQPSLPSGLIEPLDLLEHPSGNQYAFIPMTRRDFVPANQVPSAYLVYWTWNGASIEFIPGGATGPVDVLVHYMKSIFIPAQSEQSDITMINAKTFLQYRTAALCAEFIGENKSRSDDLNAMAGIALQRTLGITTKGRQAISTRRRPFMAGWRSRRIM